jgi:hypothetical protein
LLQQRQCLVDGQLLNPVQTVSQRLAFNILHREEMVSSVLANAVDLDRMRMHQPRSGGCFRVEPADEFVQPRELGWQHLDGNGPFEQRLVATIHIAHAAVADPLQDLVRSQRFKRQSAFTVSPANVHRDRGLRVVFDREHARRRVTR